MPRPRVTCTLVVEPAEAWRRADPTRDAAEGFGGVKRISRHDIHTPGRPCNNAAALKHRRARGPRSAAALDAFSDVEAGHLPLGHEVNDVGALSPTEISTDSKQSRAGFNYAGPVQPKARQQLLLCHLIN